MNLTTSSGVFVLERDAVTENSTLIASNLGEEDL